MQSRGWFSQRFLLVGGQFCFPGVIRYQCHGFFFMHGKGQIHGNMYKFCFLKRHFHAFRALVFSGERVS